MIAFGVLSALMLLGAVLVVTLRQPVHAALALVGTLLTLALSYIQLQAHFLAAIQVIVYAGAIMVLFLFVIMLLNVQNRGGGTHLPGLVRLAWTAALLGAGGVAVTVFADPRPLPDAVVIAASLGGGDAGRIGDALFGPFLLAFHLVGVLMLTGIVGAVGLVQRKPSASEAAVPAGESARFPGAPHSGRGRGRGETGSHPGDRVPVTTNGRR